MTDEEKIYIVHCHDCELHRETDHWERGDNTAGRHLRKTNHDITYLELTPEEKEQLEEMVP